MEPDDPPRKNYDFKDREFKRDNALTSGLPPAPTAKDLAIMSGLTAPRPDRSAVGSAKAGDPNDVFTVLQQNRLAAQRDGLNEVVIKNVKSRRQRDFWLVLAVVNVSFISIGLLGRHNVVVLVSAAAGVVICSLGIYWIMWQVMNDY